MNVTEVLHEIDKLSPPEKRQVAAALLHDEEGDRNATREERQAALHRRLLAAGGSKNIPPREIVAREFAPVPITGAPLSETIIRERRCRDEISNERFESNMSITEILSEVSKLSPTEKQQVIDTLLQDREAAAPPPEDEKRQELYRQLLAEGLLKNIPPRLGKPPELRDFKPLAVAGKPVSETIIEERKAN